MYQAHTEKTKGGPIVSNFLQDLLQESELY